MKKNPKRSFLTSGEIARARAGLMVSADRLDSSPERMEELQQDMIKILAKYINTEDDNIKIHILVACNSVGEGGHIGKRGISDVKTIQIK